MSQNSIFQEKASYLRGKKLLWLLLICIGFSFLYYGSSLSNDYNLDDQFMYTGNQKATQGLNNISSIFKQNTFESNTYNFGYRPITVLSFAIENEIFGINSTASHAINVVLYGLITFLFGIFIRLTFSEKNLLFLIAILAFFAAMPIHSEMVNNIKSRDELLMLFFGFIGAITALLAIKRSTAYILISIAAIFLSMLSKKSGIVFLGIIPVSFYFMQGAKLKKGILNCLLLLSPLILIRLLKKFIKASKGEVHLRTSNPIENPFYNEGIEVNPFSFALENLEFYYGKLSLPKDLVSYYGFDTIAYQGMLISNWLVLGITIALVILALKGLRQKNSISFGLILMFGALLPFLNILFPMVGIVADRFAGLASIGAAIFIVGGIYALAQKSLKEKALKATIGVVGLFLVYSFILIQDRNKEWKNEETLFEADVLKEPKSATLHALLGKEYLYQIPNEPNNSRKVNLVQKAEKHLRSSLRIVSDKIIHTELGNLLFRAKLDLKGAAQQYQKAAQMDSLYAEPIYHMGWLELERRQKQKALNYFKKAIALKENYADAYEPAIRILAETGRFNEALALNLKGKQALPKDPRFILNEANIYDLMGNKTMAKASYRAYLEKVPNDMAVARKYKSMK